MKQNRRITKKDSFQDTLRKFYGIPEVPWWKRWLRKTCSFSAIAVQIIGGAVLFWLFAVTILSL